MLCLIIVFIGSPAVADILELVNGQKYEGTLVGRSEDKVQFEVDGIVHTYDAKDVKGISFGSSAPPPADTAEPSTPPPAEQPSAKISVPAGTILMVRTQETLDTRKQGAGHKFTAKLEGDLVVDGTVAAPSGSIVYGQISEAKQSGRLVGKSEMALTFTGLMINNQIRQISSGEIKAVASSTSGRDTARKAAGGAIIGGLIDGSDGAKTGAKVGLGVAVVTRGSSINIPAGTLLEVPLTAPLTL